MKLLLMLIFLTIFSHTNFTNLNAQVTQEWVKNYGTTSGDERAYCVAVDGSGNVYVSGTVVGNPSYRTDIATIKYNSNGDSLWVRKYNGPDNFDDKVNSIVIDLSGNIYITGTSAGNLTAEDYVTVKYNSNGDSLWVKRYNGPDNQNDKPSSIAVDAFGNVYVTGTSYYFSSLEDFLTIKYNASGIQQWAKRFNGPNNHHDFANAMAIDSSGNIFITGDAGLSGGGFAYTHTPTTIKYNPNGDSLWVKRYLPSGVISGGANCIDIDASGNIYVSGWSYITSSDYTTIKYDSIGNSIWVSKYNGPGNYTDIADFIKVDALGNVYVTGHSTGSGTGFDYATIKYNSSGVEQWVQRYGGSGNNIDKPTSFAIDGLSNVYLSGYSYSGSTVSSSDYATIKYNSSGVQQWLQRYDFNGAQDLSYSMDIDGSGNVYVTGESQGDYATIKYSQQTSSLTLNLISLIEGLYNNITNKMVRDTVRIYLRNIDSPYIIVDSAKSILDSTGKGTFNFSRAVNGTPYYLAVTHRSSIETWSSTGQMFTSNSLTYDFTTAANKAYDDNQIQIGTKFCIYSGDINQDGTVDVTDLGSIDNDANNFVSGYVKTDLNGDGFVDVSDYSISDNNAYNFVSVRNPIVAIYHSKKEPFKNQGKKSEASDVQKEFSLKDNYPNPFNPLTKINFELPASDFVSLKIFDITDKEVMTLVNERQDAERYSFQFEGSKQSSGIYYYKIVAGDFIETKRMELIK